MIAAWILFSIADTDRDLFGERQLAKFFRVVLVCSHMASSVPGTGGSDVVPLGVPPHELELELAVLFLPSDIPRR